MVEFRHSCPSPLSPLDGFREQLARTGWLACLRQKISPEFRLRQFDAKVRADGGEKGGNLVVPNGPTKQRLSCPRWDRVEVPTKILMKQSDRALVTHCDKSNKEYLAGSLTSFGSVTDGKTTFPVENTSKVGGLSRIHIDRGPILRSAKPKRKFFATIPSSVVMLRAQSTSYRLAVAIINSALRWNVIFGMCHLESPSPRRLGYRGTGLYQQVRSFLLGSETDGFEPSFDAPRLQHQPLGPVSLAELYHFGGIAGAKINYRGLL